MRVEADRDGAGGMALGCFRHCLQDLAVAAVDPVEVPDRDYRWTEASRDGFKAFPIVHGIPLIGGAASRFKTAVSIMAEKFTVHEP
ncbi:hypothetical protein GCM10023166_01360 [Paeniglutamicibacter cryotolerans]